MTPESIVMIVVGLFTVLTAVLTFRGGKDARLDTERAADRVRMSERVATLEAKVEQLEQHGRIKDDYIYTLRNHIAKDLGSPPPEWPQELRRD